MADPYAQFADQAGDPYAQFADHTTATTSPLQPQSWADWLKNVPGQLANQTIRAGVKAVTALPLMAEDAGVAVRDLMAGKNAQGQYPYELPSTSVNRALDQYTQAPTTTGGKISEFASSAIMGAGVPGPIMASQVPSNFVPSATTAQQTLAQGRNAGYVVPPSTSNPTIGNRILESIGGKTGTAQDAALANMPVTNNLARSALGMDIGAEITPAALGTIRATAGQAYNGLAEKIGTTLPTDAAYADKLASIAGPYEKLAQELGPEFGNPKLTDMVSALNKPEMSPQAAIKATQVLREKADAAFGQGDKVLGKSYKALASNIEDLIERHLSNIGETDALTQMQAARQTIAKSYSVQSALNTATGNVSAIKLGQQLAKGKPLSGDLFTAAQMGMAFPKATKEILDSGSVRNTDVILGGLAALAKHEPSLLLYPFARQGARAALLSDVGQNLAMPGSALPSTGLAGLSESVIAQWDLAK